MPTPPVRNPGRVVAAIQKATANGTLRVGQAIANAFFEKHGTMAEMGDLFYMEDETLADLLEQWNLKHGK